MFKLAMHPQEEQNVKGAKIPYLKAIFVLDKY